MRLPTTTVFTDEEMQRIISECNKREKVIILLMVAGGVLIGAISKLKVKNLEPITVNGDYSIYKITVDGDSRHAEYWITCNVKCVSAIKEYLQQREQQGEGPVKDNSPLIREYRDSSKDIFQDMLKMIQLDMRLDKC
jgi:hypothetical protein